MEFDFKNKTYALRNGFEYRNYCEDAGGKYPIQGAYKNRDGIWVQIAHQTNGQSYQFLPNPEEHDLIESNKPQTVTFWVNYYPGPVFISFATKELADKNAVDSRIVCLEITRTFIAGEGLDDKK